jgi:hypothetical protein
MRGFLSIGSTAPGLPNDHHSVTIPFMAVDPVPV